MRNLHFIIVVFIIFLLTYSSCSNEFEITEPKSDIPVVYGIISAQDTATYIRVEKAFVDENVPAGTLAKDPANLYFDDVVVKIKHVKTGLEYSLNKVDGNIEGYKRDEGAFASAPNYLYKITKSQLKFIPEDEYQLIVTKNDTTLTTAKTKVLTPMSDDKGDVNPPALGRELNFGYTSDFKITWYPSDNALIHDVILTVNYSENVNGVVAQKSVDWSVVNNYTEKLNANNFTYSTKGRQFYEFMASNIKAPDAGSVVTRIIKDATLTIISGDKAIKDYITIGRANLGITSSGEIPVFTNMSHNGRGIFSSKSEFERTGILFSKNTLDSLRNGIITKSLNFK